MLITEKSSIRDYISEGQRILSCIVKKDSSILSRLKSGVHVVLIKGENILIYKNSKGDEVELSFKCSEKVNIGKYFLEEYLQYDIDQVMSWVSGLAVSFDNDLEDVYINSINFNNEVNICDACIKLPQFETRIYSYDSSDYSKLINFLKNKKVKGYSGIYDSDDEVVSWGMIKGLEEEIILSFEDLNTPIHSVIISGDDLKYVVLKRESIVPGELDLLIG